jgi:hypothetical protein
MNPNPFGFNGVEAGNIDLPSALQIAETDVQTLKYYTMLYASIGVSRGAQ